MQIHTDQQEDFEKRDWAKFVNSLSGFKSANLIATKDSKDQHNLAIVSSAFHMGANPPLMGLLFRPARSPRHSLENIKSEKYFTLNHVNQDIYRKAHQTSARYPKELSEFDAVGLTKELNDDFPVAYVKEARIKLGMELVRVQFIPENDTELVIAKIKTVIFPKEIMSGDMHLNIAKAGTISVSGLDHYHECHSIERLSYAKPDKELSSIE